MLETFRLGGGGAPSLLVGGPYEFRRSPLLGRLPKVIPLMHLRPAEPWTVEKLASAVGLSRSGFAARFTALVGEPPLEYLGGWRMTKAARLVREGDDSTSAVAGHGGHRSDAAFNRAFKRWEGKGPGAYRRANSRLRRT
jgi:AraC-like DNA-binding protein